MATTPNTIRLYGTAPDSIVDGPGLRYSVFVQGCSHKCPGCHNPKSQPHQGGVERTLDEIVDEIESNGLVHDVTLSGGEPFEQAAAAAELARRLKSLGYGIWTYTGYLYEELRTVVERANLGETCAMKTRDEAEESSASATRENVSRGTSDGKLNTDKPSKDKKDVSRETIGVCERDARENVSHETFFDEAENPAPDAAGLHNDGAGSPVLDAAGVRTLLEVTDVLVDGPFVESKKSLGLQWRGSSNQRLIDVSASRAAGKVVLWHSHEDFPQKPASW